MPTYSLESPQTGQKYQVQFDGEPSPADLEFAAQHFDNEWWKQQGIEPGSAITRQTPLETVGNAIANVGPNLVDMVGGGMRYLDKAAQIMADVTGTQRGGLFADVAKQAEGIKAEGDVLRPLSPANPTAQAIGGGASQGIGLMATAAASVPALGARGLMAVPAVLGFGAGGGAGVQQAEQMGITSPAAQLGMGTAFGAAEAGTEALGGIGGAFFKPAKTMLGRMAGGVLSEGIEEPAAGALQDAITNVAGLAVADPKRPGFTTTGFQLPGPAGYLERRQQEAIGGLAGGLVFAGVQPLMRGPVAGQPLSEAPAAAPDAVPESTGDLTAADVADLEAESGGQRADNPRPSPRQPILTGVPDAVPAAVTPSPMPSPVVDMPGDIAPPETAPAPTQAVAPQVDMIPAESAAQAPQDPSQTITGSNEQTGSEMPVPPPTAAADAWAGGVTQSNTTASTPATAAQTAPAASGGGAVAGQTRSGGEVGTSAESSGVTLLRQLNAELPANAQAKWTPEVYAKAESYMQSGNAADLEGLTDIQKRRVINARIDADPVLTRQQQEADRRAEQRANTMEKRDRSFESKTTFKNLIVDRDLEAGFMSDAGLQAMREMAAAAVKAGQSFAQWSQAMVRRFGQAIRAYLAGVWDNVRRNSELGAVMNPLARGPAQRRVKNEQPAYLGTTGWKSFRDAIGAIDPAAMGAANGRSRQATDYVGTTNAELQKLWFAAPQLRPLPPTQIEGREHRVALLPDGKRVVKETHPETFGYGFDPAAPEVLKRTSPLQYLQRWRLFNEVFPGADVAFEGVVLHSNGQVSLRISQPRLDGPHPSFEQIETTLKEAGYRKTAINTWEKAWNGGILRLTDAKPSNFIVVGDTVVPVDVILEEISNDQGFTNLDTSGRTAGFLNTEILAEARQLIADGFTTFANWSQAMVTRFGRGIRDFLAGIWQQITSPQTNAAQNVRLGMPQGNAPVSIGAGGFVGGGQASNIPGGQDVTRSRFASPDEAANLYDVQATETMRAESAAWIDANGLDAALAALESNTAPAGLRIDHLPSLGSALITRLAKLAETGTEAQRIAADAGLDRAARAWHGKASQEAGRTLQQRAMANQELMGIAPILATKQVLVDRADRVVKERFEGGAEGAVAAVKDIEAKASTDASSELATDLDAETAKPAGNGGNAIPPSKVRSKHPNLKKMLDALRKKVAPWMTWADIFMTLPAEQKARQREIYRRLMLDERLKALNQGERLQLTNELDRAWQRERRKVFLRELEKITNLGKSKEDRKKVKAALPRLLRLMNLGMLNSETFRGAIAQEYGIKQIDVATGAELRKLGEQIQQAPEGLPRRKLEQQLMQRLQNLTGSTMAEILESWWTASVLSGWRTQMDIALSLANGLEDVTFGSLVTALRTGNGRVIKDALFGMLSNLPTAMNEALDHLLTGNRAAMRGYDAEVKAALEDGNKLFGNVGRQLLNKGGMAKLPGAFMEFVSRLMTALDHINSTSVYEGAKAMALARHPELYEKALTISLQDRQAARNQARLELTAGEAPTTRQQRVEEDARVKEILDQRVPLEFQAQAREIGLESALQGEPTGLGHFIYKAANNINQTMRQAEAAYDKSRPDNAAGKAVLAALRLSSTLVKVLTGTKFVRTVGHSVNRSLSYAPGIGLVRFAEGGMKGAKADILLARQLIGTAVGLALLAAFRDGEDDEQGIEGSWRELTPQQKGQLLAEGKQPYSIWTRDAQGKIRTWNYQQWGIAGVLATIGGMEDQRRYNSQGKDDLAILLDGITSGAMAWTDKTQLTGLQMLMGKDQAATSSPSSSLAGALNKWASATVGGLVPRLFKDVDMVISPQLRDSSEWWMKWAGQVPMVRELSSGKRVNIFGEDIVLDRGPTSRITQVGTIDPALRTLGRLNERDIWLPDPTQGVRTVLLADGIRRKMTTAEKDRYQRATGAAYRKFITEHGAALLQMDAELARETISKVTERLRRQAAYDAVRR